MQLPSASGQISNKTTFSNLRWPAAPLTLGLPHWCHGFCQSGLLSNKFKILPFKTLAKTHATPTLRQLAHTAERWR